MSQAESVNRKADSQLLITCEIEQIMYHYNAG